MEDSNKAEYFANKLCLAIGQSNLSISEIAKRSGLPTNIIINWQQEKVFPKLSSLVKLAKVFNKNVSWFINE
ncbi:helix-turn-helix domain-containing protein [Oenococcus oeni]|uniref:Transcriptional regulator n=1 Tax=Oenococcus oeni TaxID=1247 RepID=A0A6N4A2D4_OENOE|nr:helix-turn-helix transcriptional regulator [Oenococcus oeni]KGI00351.1 XRE family transcriptional regulator [Oenococcus oeni IOEB_C52]OIM21359.1 transcriptional regulator [Oenococcus oeni]